MDRRRIARATGVIGAVAASMLAVVVGASPASAAPGGTFHFEDRQRVYDSRDRPGGLVPAGTGIPLYGPVFYNVTVSEPQTAGRLTVGPCDGSSPQATVLGFEPDQSVSTLVFVGLGECVIPSATTELIIDRNSRLDAVPSEEGFSYVPLAQPRTLLDTFSGASIGGGSFALSTSGPGVPPGVAGVALRLRLVGDLGYILAHECGSGTYAVDLGSGGDYQETTAFTRVDANGVFCLDAYVPSGTIDVSVELLGYFVSDDTAPGRSLPPTLVVDEVLPPGLVPNPPDRVLDTRTGRGAPLGKVAAGGILRLDLAGKVGPDTDSVVMNLTATEADGAGYLTAYPCDDDLPPVSNVNFEAGENVPNLVMVQLAADASVCLFAYQRTHVVADLAGRFDVDAGDRYLPVTPVRLLDTRDGTGRPSGKLSAGAPVRLQVAGTSGVPVGASAATFNLTVTEPDSAGYLTAYPCDQAVPDASNVNFVGGQTVPNLATVKLDATGGVCLYPYATTHVLVDLAGWFGPGGTDGFVALPPDRVVDTREEPEGKLDARGDYILDLGLADAGIRVDALALNLTATEPDGPGYLTAYPCAGNVPNASNVNYVRGENVANLAVAKLDDDALTCVFTWETTHLVMDLFGLFTPTPTWVPELRT